jgi:homoserine acetyltransferase
MLSESTDPSTGRKKIGVPSLAPDFLIETYLDHQGERFCLTYDANSMIYLSKAMDLFDMTEEALVGLADKFKEAYPDEERPFPYPSQDTSLSEQTRKQDGTGKKSSAPFIPTSKSPHLASLSRGLSRLRQIPALILGVQSDVLFPVEQQRELADALKLAGNEQVTYYELGGVWGHDTFLLDVQGVGGAIRGFLH